MEEQHKLSKLFKISSSFPNTVSLENKSDVKINSVNTEIKPSVETSISVNEISGIFTFEMLPYFSSNGTKERKTLEFSLKFVKLRLDYIATDIRGSSYAIV